MGSRHFLIAAASVALALAADARAQDQGAAGHISTRPSIAVPCMSIFVGSRNSLGQFVLNDDWVRATALNFHSAIESTAPLRAANVRFPECDPVNPDERINEVKTSVYNLLLDRIFQVPPGTFPIADNDFQGLRRLRGTFEYRVSEDVLGRLATLYGDADYFLLVTTYDAYSTPGAVTGRIVTTLIGAPLNGQPHYTSALLLNGRTGSIEWVNAVSTGAGNPRDPDGAARRLARVFRNFPSLGPSTP